MNENRTDSIDQGERVSMCPVKIDGRILDRLIQSTILRLEHEKQDVPLSEMKARATVSGTPFAFERALKRKDGGHDSEHVNDHDRGISFICEIKKASPSKGVLSKEFPYVAIAREYQRAGAGAISILTEPEFFMGSMEYLKEVRAEVDIPILQKDFFIDEYQIYQAATMHADAILLIASILDVEKIREFIQIADEFGISCLVETHDAKEIETAIAAGARIIGVNNRNLQTFVTDIANSIRLRSLVPPEILFVAESGIRTRDDVKRLQAIACDAVLIGETLMKSGNIKEELSNLMGEEETVTARNSDASAAAADGRFRAYPKARGFQTRIKICGIKSFNDIDYVNETLPDFIGFVFAKSSRHVDFNRAYLLKSMLDRQIKAVGVFVNEEIVFIQKCCDSGVIDLVQLHGDEDDAYIRQLKKTVFKPIIKVFRMKPPAYGASLAIQEGTRNDACSEEKNGNEETDRNKRRKEKRTIRLVDYALYDAFDKDRYGGSGNSFDWTLLEKPGRPFFLAGGLCIANVEDAIRSMNPFCVDVSSGVETDGVKDRKKIIDFINAARSVR